MYERERGRGREIDYRFWGPAAKKLSVLGAGRMKLLLLGTSGDHLGPSGDHYSKKLSIVSRFYSNYVFFSKTCTFQIYVIFHQDFD